MIESRKIVALSFLVLALLALVGWGLVSTYGPANIGRELQDANLQNGVTLLRQGKLAEAERHLLKATEEIPFSTLSNAFLAHSYYKRYLATEESQWLTRVDEVLQGADSPYNLPYQYLTAVIDWESGDKTGAAKRFARCHDLLKNSAWSGFVSPDFLENLKDWLEFIGESPGEGRTPIRTEPRIMWGL